MVAVPVGTVRVASVPVRAAVLRLVVVLPTMVLLLGMVFFLVVCFLGMILFLGEVSPLRIVLLLRRVASVVLRRLTTPTVVVTRFVASLVPLEATLLASRKALDMLHAGISDLLYLGQQRVVVKCLGLHAPEKILSSVAQEAGIAELFVRFVRQVGLVRISQVVVGLGPVVDLDQVTQRAVLGGQVLVRDLRHVLDMVTDGLGFLLDRGLRMGRSRGRSAFLAWDRRGGKGRRRGGRRLSGYFMKLASSRGRCRGDVRVSRGSAGTYRSR